MTASLDTARRLRALAEKAFRAPWALQESPNGGLIVLRGGVVRGDHPQTHLQIVPAEDARFIVAARNGVEGLVEVIERYEKALERISGEECARPAAAAGETFRSPCGRCPSCIARNALSGEGKE